MDLGTRGSECRRDVAQSQVGCFKARGRGAPWEEVTGQRWEGSEEGAAEGTSSGEAGACVNPEGELKEASAPQRLRRKC